ncbi:MAG: hypothetical protein IJ934_03155 [Acetobacter sp.]|nr:hypothetical protein [Acetobacter sp.]
MAGQFLLLNQKADHEISETIRVYLNGVPVATFRLDENHQNAIIPVSFTNKPTQSHNTLDITYTLCGSIIFLNKEGQTITRIIDSTGVLHNPDGHRFYITGAKNFTESYLFDPNAPKVADPLFHHTPSDVCSIPVS